MKKLLEVLQYSDTDIRFNTDIKVESNPEIIPMTELMAAVTMATKLWGGNERSVIAMIRALAIADLAVSVNRKEMLKFFGESAEEVSRELYRMKTLAEKRGVKVMTFGPGVDPSKAKS